MVVSIFIGVSIFLFLIGYLVSIYNGLVRVKHAVEKSWSNIEVLLKQRNSELPKLVETCKQYMDYEGDTLQKVISARSGVMNAQKSGSIGEIGQAETAMRGSLMNLFAVAEDYPDLKASDSFSALQSRISELESEISDRREFYNESVNQNNIMIEQFPDVIVAKQFNFEASDLMEFEDKELTDVSVKELFE